jgi:hypothetical protein
MTDKVLTEPDFDSRITAIEERLIRLEGEFYQFQYALSTTLANSERSATRIYRITFALIFLGIGLVLSVIVKMLYDIANKPSPGV